MPNNAFISRHGSIYVYTDAIYLKTTVQEETKLILAEILQKLL